MISGLAAQRMYEEMLRELERIGAVAMMNRDDEARTRSMFAERFGAMFDPATSPATGKRAEVLYTRERPAAVLVLSQPKQRFTPSMSASPVHFAILCELSNDAPPPPLGRFADLEPCVLEDDFDWVMLHTHEDYSLGGPYFVRAESVFSGARHLPR